MQSAAKAVMDYYGDTDYTAVQFHGMSDLACPGMDAYITHGNGVSPNGGEKIAILKQELENLESGGIFNVPGDTPSCDIMGRWIQRTSSDA
jgi:hypothetical protein